VLVRYKEQLSQLQAGLAMGIATADAERAEAMRDLLNRHDVSRSI